MSPEKPDECSRPRRMGDAETVDFGSASHSTLGPGTLVRYVGEYELLEEIARGGMGVVYRARQSRLRRIVALKMMLSGNVASDTDIRRFHAEAESAAQLDHPHIVPVFEVGEHEGMHFFSMGFVEGRSLADRLRDEGPLTPRSAAEIVAAVAEAVHYAHGKGVVHRDLKPGNILLDASGQPRVTDFGLAKQLRADASQLTGTGQILGTPSYMPPEQALGQNASIREAADVYALGAVLYAALTARPPFQGDSPTATLRMVVEREPVPPRQLNPSIPSDLDTVCLKCLEKGVSRRYATAQEVSDELRRYLAGVPIQARPISNTQRLWKWCQRHQLIAGLLASAAVLLIAAIVVSYSSYAIADGRAREYDRLSRQSMEMASKAREARDAANESQRFADERTRATRRESARLRLGEARALCDTNNVTAGLLKLPAAHQLATDAGDPALAEAARVMASLWLAQTPRLRRVFLQLPQRGGGAYLRDGQKLVVTGTAYRGHEVEQTNETNVRKAREVGLRVYDAESGELLERVENVHSPTDLPIISPACDKVLLIDADDKPRVWSLVERRWVGNPLDASDQVVHAVFVSNGQRIVTITRTGHVQVWSSDTGAATGIQMQHPGGKSVYLAGRVVSLDPRGDLFVSLRHQDPIQTWNAATGEAVRKWNANRGHTTLVSVTHDQQRWITCHSFPSYHVLIQTADDKHHPLASAPSQRARGISSRPSDSRWFVEVGAGNQMVFRDGRLAREVGAPALVKSDIFSTSYHPRRDEATIGYTSGSIEAWSAPLKLSGDSTTDETRPRVSHWKRADGKVLRATSNGVQSSFKPTVGELFDDHPELPATTLCTQVAPVGTHLIGATAEGRIFLANMGDGRISLSETIHQGEIRAFLVSPQGTYLATVSERETRVWNVGDLRAVGASLPIAVDPDSLSFSTDEKLLACQSSDRALVHLIRTETGSFASRDRLAGTIARLHPSGEFWLAAGGRELVVWTRDMRSATRRWTASVDPLSRFIFSPDGRWVLVQSLDERMQLWDFESGKPLGVEIFGATLEDRLLIHPSGRFVTAYRAGFPPRHWHVASGELLGSPPFDLGDDGPWRGWERYVYSADGRSVLPADAEVPYRLVDPPEDNYFFRMWIESWVGQRLEGDDIRLLARSTWTQQVGELAAADASFAPDGLRPTSSRHERLVAIRAASPLEIDGQWNDWSRAEPIMVIPDRRFPERRAVRIAAQWDQDYLYLGLDWVDSTPLVNHVDSAKAPAEGWRADAFQGRFLLGDQQVHLTAWYATDLQRSVACFVRGEIAKPVSNRVFVGEGMTQSDSSGFSQAFSVKENGSGYVQELRIPWSLLDETARPQAGDSPRFSGQFFWGGPDARDWPQIYVSDPMAPQAKDDVKLHERPENWGQVELRP